MTLIDQTGNASTLCRVPGPLDWPSILYTMAFAVAMALLTYVTQVTRRLDKRSSNGGE